MLRQRNRCVVEKNGTGNDILTFEGNHISEDASLYDPTSVLRDFTPPDSLSAGRRNFHLTLRTRLRQIYKRLSLFLPGYDYTGLEKRSFKHSTITRSMNEKTETSVPVINCPFSLYNTLVTFAKFAKKRKRRKKRRTLQVLSPTAREWLSLRDILIQQQRWERDKRGKEHGNGVEKVKRSRVGWWKQSLGGGEVKENSCRSPTVGIHAVALPRAAWWWGRGQGWWRAGWWRAASRTWAAPCARPYFVWASNMARSISRYLAARPSPRAPTHIIEWMYRSSRDEEKEKRTNNICIYVTRHFFYMRSSSHS